MNTFTILQTFWAAYTLLDELHKQKLAHDENLTELLIDMNPFIFSDRTSADPALWAEWNELAKETQNNSMIVDADAFELLCLFLHKNEQLYRYCTKTILQELESSVFQERWSNLLIMASKYSEDN